MINKSAWPPKSKVECKLVSYWADMAASYHDVTTDTVWTWNNCTRSWVNGGSLENHRKAIQTGRLRGVLV